MTHISPQMRKMLIYVGLFFALVFGVYGVKKLGFWWYISHMQEPPITISSIKATSTTWQSYLTAVGSLNAVNGVDLSAEVAGIVREIRFNSGQAVKTGDVVIVLESSVEQATLKDNSARLKLAQINYDRENQLFKKNVTSKAALDQRVAELQEAEANVEEVQAKLKQKTIAASFDGRLGIRQVNLGEYISPGKVMVTLQSLNPLYVTFNLPEQNLSSLYINQPVDVTVNLGSGKKIAGTITAINSKVDQATRNIEIQATIPNEQSVLYPGMFALVTVWLKAEQHIVVIPQTAISYSLSGDFVFVIKDESADKDGSLLRVYRQYIKVGERRDDVVSIVDGLKAGEIIVTSGQLKLQNGARVVINNSVEL